jgi:hypothetical protein
LRSTLSRPRPENEAGGANAKTLAGCGDNDSGGARLLAGCDDDGAGGAKIPAECDDVEQPEDVVPRARAQRFAEAVCARTESSGASRLANPTVSIQS